MAPTSNELKSTNYEIFIGMLSVLSILNIVFMYAFLQDGNLQNILSAMNTLLSAIFMGDFVYRISDRSVEVGLLLPRVRLGGPPREPAVRPAEDIASVQTHPRVSVAASDRAEAGLA